MAKIFSNTYIEPGATTTISASRQQYNSSLRSILTNFKSNAIPTFTNITVAGETIGEQDGMLFRSDQTGALYISDAIHKKNTPIGGNFTRVGIGARLEESVDSLAANAETYEIGELITIVSQNTELSACSTVYLCASNATVAGSLDGFIDIGNLGAVSAAQFLRLRANSLSFTYDSEGAPDPLVQTVDFTADVFNITDNVVFTTSPEVTLTGTGYSRSLSVADFGTNQSVTVTATANTFSDSVTIVRLQDGINTVSAVLDNEAHTITADFDGSNPQLSGASTSMQVFVGATEDTDNWTFSRANSTGITSTIVDNTVTVTAMTVDDGYVDITASKSGYSDITKRFTLSKAKKGNPGIDALEVEISSAATTLSATSDGVVTSYAGSGVVIRAFEGSTTLDYTTDTNVPNVSTWSIVSTTVYTGTATSTDITVGTITDGGTYAIVGNHSSMSDSVDSVRIEYELIIKLADGSTQTRIISQSISKAKTGNAGTDAKLITLSGTGQTFTFDGDNNADPVVQTITFTAVLQNTDDTTATWSSSPSVFLSGTGNTRTLEVTNFGSNDSVTITVTADSGAVTDSITVYRLKQGATGADAVSAFLTNEAHTIPADADGSNPDLTSAITDMKVFVGVTDDTNNWTFSRTNSTGITSTIVGNTVTVTGMAIDEGYVDITASKSGYSNVTKRFTLTKSKAGNAGTDAKLITLSSTGQTFTFDGENTADPSAQTITFTASLQNTDDTTATWSSSPSVTLGGTGNTRTLSVTDFSVNDSVTITVTADNGAVSDSITVYRITNGLNGVPTTTFSAPYLSDADSSPDTNGNIYFRESNGTSADNNENWSNIDQIRIYNNDIEGTNQRDLLNRVVIGGYITAYENNSNWLVAKVLSISELTDYRLFSVTPISYVGSYHLPTVYTVGWNSTGINAKLITLSATGQTFTFDGNNNADPSVQTITFTAALQNTDDTTATWSSSPSVTLGGTGNTRTLSVADFGSNDSVTITVTADSGTVTDSISVYRLTDGTAGADAVSAFLTNEAHTVPADADGSNPDLSSAITDMKVFVGITDDSSNWTFSRTNSTGVTSTIVGNTVTVTAMTVDEGYVDITAAKSGYSNVTKRFTLTKSKTGEVGADSVSAFLTNEAHTVPADADGSNPDLSSAITDMKVFVGITDDSSNWTFSRTNSTGVTSTIVGNTVTVTAMTVDEGYVDITAAKSGYSNVTKRFTLTKSKAGTSAKSIDVSSTGQTFTFDGDNNADPSVQTITFTATLQNTNDTTATWSSSPTVTLGGTGNTRTLSVADFGSNNSVTITVTADSGAVSDSITVYRVKDGATGADAVSAYLTNESISVPANADGSNPDLSSANTEIKIFIGAVDDTTNWSFTTSVPAGITITRTDNLIEVDTLTVNEAYVDITASKSGYSNITKRFTISKTIQGIRGAGRWNIDVDGVTYNNGSGTAQGELPVTSDDAQEAWDEGTGYQPSTPSANDQAWFYKGLEASPSEQSVWLYNGTSWNKQTEVIDGNLLVTGTLNADDIQAGTLQADRILTDNVTITGTVNGISVPELGVDEINLSPGLELNAHATRLIDNALESFYPINAVDMVVGERYIISSNGTTNWGQFDGTSPSVLALQNGYGPGNEILIHTTPTGTGQGYKGRQELIPGDTLEFIQAYYHEATVHYSVYQRFYQGTWGVYLRQTAQDRDTVDPEPSALPVYLYDFFANTAEANVYSSYNVFLLREPEVDKNFKNTNYWVHQIENAALTTEKVYSANRGSTEYYNTVKSREYDANFITDAKQNLISASLPVTISGGSATAKYIKPGNDYIIMKIRDGGSLEAVGVDPDNYRAGYRFTANADGSVLSSTDQSDNRIGRIFRSDELVPSNFYLTYKASSNTANIAGVQALGAQTGKRNEVFRALTRPSVALTGSGNSRTLSVANFANNDSVTITVMADDWIVDDSITVYKLVANSGKLVGFLTNEYHMVPSDEDGNNPNLTGATSDMKVYIGIVDDTSNWSFSRINSTGVSSTISGNTITVTGMTVDKGYVDVTATKSGEVSITKRMNLRKSKKASNPENISLSASSQIFTYNSSEIPDPSSQSISLSATLQNTTDSSATWSTEAKKDYDYEFLLCAIERFSLQWSGKSAGPTGLTNIDNVTASLTVKGLKR